MLLYLICQTGKIVLAPLSTVLVSFQLVASLGSDIKPLGFSSKPLSPNDKSKRQQTIGPLQDRVT